MERDLRRAFQMLEGYADPDAARVQSGGSPEVVEHQDLVKAWAGRHADGGAVYAWLCGDEAPACGRAEERIDRRETPPRSAAGRRRIDSEGEL